MKIGSECAHQLFLVVSVEKSDIATKTTKSSSAAFAEQFGIAVFFIRSCVP